MTFLIMPLSFVNQLFFQLQAGVWKNFWHLCNSGLPKSLSEPLPSCYWQQPELRLCYFWWVWCCSLTAGKGLIIRTQKLIPHVGLQEIYLFDTSACSFPSGTGKWGGGGSGEEDGQGPEIERGKHWMWHSGWHYEICNMRAAPRAIVSVGIC